ncbi:MAG TPA: DNA repair exonuclease [Candidatus Nanopelagicales bacterium]|nr:DNA repair exonuclease [Candidatus Nanopelagicales bacterium]
MLRLLHTADVHLGARHADLGEQAAAQRERQFAAFRATVDLALAEKVDLVLVAGDLFDSNTQPRRSVERVAAELKRLAEAAIRTVIIPGTHDVYDGASVYRAYDLAAMAGLPPDTDRLVVLTPDRVDVLIGTLDLVVHGRVFATKRAPRSPLADFSVAADERATWHVGMIHGSLRIPEKTEHDEVVFTSEEVGASHLDYLALGHWHSTQRGRAGATLWAYSGAPEPVAIDQDRAGSVLLVTLEERGGGRHVTVEERRVGRTRFERLEVDAVAVGSQPALVERLIALADPDLVLDVRIIGVRPDDLDLATDEIEREVAERFFRVRVRDTSSAALPAGPLPPPDTIAGALVRDLEAEITELETAGRDGDAGEAREALRLARLLLDGREVTL